MLFFDYPKITGNAYTYTRRFNWSYMSYITQDIFNHIYFPILSLCKCFEPSNIASCYLFYTSQVASFYVLSTFKISQTTMGNPIGTFDCSIIKFQASNDSLHTDTNDNPMYDSNLLGYIYKL